MALSAPALSALMRSAMLAAPSIQAINSTGLTALCDALAGAVVTHIQAAAVVTIPPGVPVATAGSPSAQAGATTAPAIRAIT